MVDQITVPSYEQIETMLTKLATNYSNLAILFYDIFYNTTPMDVTFQMFNEEGVIQTYTIPNRAKDMRNILSGNGSPQGTVEATKGVIYQDLANGDSYIKLTNDGDTGWTKFITVSDMKNTLIEGVGSPENVVTADKGTLYVDRANATLYIKAEESGNYGWAIFSADTSNLANKDLSNLTTSGEAHFANPSLSNLTTAGNNKFNAKENTSNKVTSITSSSNNTQYPSAKAVYTYVTNSISNFADKDLSNISSSAENKFVNVNKLRDGIIEAPSLLARGADNSFTLPYGTVILCANGLNANYTLNNRTVTITQSHLTGAVPSVASSEGYIFYDDDYAMIRTPKNSEFFYSTQQPAIVANGVWFNPVESKYYIIGRVSNQDAWVPVVMAEIGRWSTKANGTINTFEPYYPIKLVSTKSNEVSHVVVETGGTEDNWYRLYNDGWLEMGGYKTGGGTVNLKKRFKSTHYTLVPSANATSFTKAVDSFTLTVSNNSAETDWMAKGWAE